MDREAWWATVHRISKESDMTLVTKQQQTVYYSIIGTYTFDHLHLPLPPPPTSAYGNHESDLFFYEFVCLLAFN